MTLPLQGIRVIEFCNVAAGPFCGMLLADMGADVIGSTTLRATNQVALKAFMEAEFAKHTAEELLAKFRAAGVPCAPINTYSKALDDEQVKHMEWAALGEHNAEVFGAARQAAQ